MPSDPPPTAAAPRAVGVLLAAGSGTRMGRPKALVADPATGELWLTRGIRTLLAGGCSSVVVVLGAAHAEARALLADETGDRRGADPLAAGSGDPRAPLDAPLHITIAEEWADGLAASLRTGLTTAEHLGADLAVITLVDLPHLDPRAITRLLSPAAEPTALRQATYDGRPGHPVVIGSAHFALLAATLSGDRGARPYLRAHGVTELDCTDLGGGDDIDSLPGTAPAG